MVQRVKQLNSMSDKSEGAVLGVLRDAQHMVSEGCRGLQAILAQEIRHRPLTTVAATLGLGFFLGRYRVRPAETVLLAAGTGLLAGLALSSGSCARGESDAGCGGPNP